MCKSSPLYSPGLLTSTSDPLASRCFSTSSLKARISESFRVGTGERRHVLGHLAALGLPLDPSAVHDLDVVVAEETEDPEGVGGPPVVPVPVEDDRGIGGDALLGHQVREVLGVE